MAKPKLCLIPAAQGDKFYSVLPSSGVGDFDFTRSGGATRINKDGLIETVADGVSRLNYPLIDGKVVGCPSHLLEPQRTNFVTYSNNFLDSSWLPTGLTVSGGVISPDGTANAFTITNTAPSGIIQKAVSVTGTRIVSIFAKKETHRYLRLGAYGGTSSYANFDLENGVVTDGANAIIENYGNGWFRCTCHTVSGTTGGVQIFPTNNPIGAATTNGSIHIYGVHLQNASVGVVNPTSYIPTTTSATTRSAETASNSGDASTFNSEGVLMAEISALADDGTARRIYINNSDNSKYIILEFSSTIGRIRAVLFNGSTQADLLTTAYNQIDNNKIAFKYKENDFALWVNGVEVDTEPSGTTFNNGDLEKMLFSYVSSVNFYGNTKQIQYFDSALTDSDLEKLTSWVSFSDMAEGQLYTIE